MQLQKSSQLTYIFDINDDIEMKNIDYHCNV